MSHHWSDFEQWVMVGGNVSNDVFHSADDCPMIDDPERAVSRSENYVRSHEPTPCYQCHDGVERNNPNPEYDVPAIEDHDDGKVSREEAGRRGHAARGPPRECTCPKCGKEGIKSLPIHMRACDGDQATLSD